MPSLAQKMLPMIERASGRCHSCAHEQRWDLPIGSRFYCAAYSAEMNDDARDNVRGCPRWTARRLPGMLSCPAASVPLVEPLLDTEDELFWQLKLHLDRVGVDLKSLLLLAQPGLDSSRQLRWVDSLEDRFGDRPARSFAAIAAELRASKYDSLCEMAERVIDKDAAHA